MNNFLNFHLSIEKKTESLDCEIQRVASLKDNFFMNVKENTLRDLQNTDILTKLLEKYRENYA